MNTNISLLDSLRFRFSFLSTSTFVWVQILMVSDNPNGVIQTKSADWNSEATSQSLEHKFNQYRLTSNETVVADTEYGKVKGVKRTSIYDDTYFSFEKIPFAKPPINNLRFKAPEPPEPWTDVLDCTSGNVAPLQLQFVYNKVDGSEDCLYLNVYTNNLEPTQPRPVMVWIYGGGFIMGEADRDWYGPDYFIKKDIVLVTINYRLGPFGFLSLKDPSLDVPGNAGLKDQVLALKWVKNNCARFGGDPDNITVFGESAGGASTNYMSITDQTKGLFHRAILMSGCITTPWAITAPKEAAYRLAKSLGYKGEDNDKEVLTFLEGVKAHDLIADHSKLLTPEEQASGILFRFGPVIEPYETKHSVIPKTPIEMLKTAWSNKIPIMMGATSDEGLIFYPYLKVNPFLGKELETLANTVPNEIVSDKTSPKCLELGGILKEAHVVGESPDPIKTFIEILSYKHFLHPIHRFILARFKYAEAPTYLYRFDFESSDLINPYYLMRRGRELRGVSHADELSYLFSSLLAHKLNKNSREYKTIERMTAIWSEFATTGNPNAEIIKPLTWTPLEKGSATYKVLNISDEVEIKEWPEMEKIRIWDSIYPKELL